MKNLYLDQKLDMHKKSVEMGLIMNLLILNIVMLISKVFGFIYGYFFYKILCGIGMKKEGKVWTVLIYFSCVILSSMVIFANDMFNIILDLIWFILMMLLGFRGKFIAKISMVAIFYPLIIAQNFLVMEILGYLYIETGKIFLIDIFCTLMDGFIHIAIWYTIYKIFMKRIILSSKLFDTRIWTFLFIICLASFVNIITLIGYAPVSKHTYKIWAGAFACIITNIGSLYLSEYFIKNIQQQMEQKNLKLQQDYYEELEKNQTEIRKFRHDMNHHLIVIRELFESGNKENARVYLEEVEEQISIHNRVFCKNSIVNAVLNAKYNLATNEKIDCFFHIDLPEVLAIDPISLCSIFSNTMNNAIDASLKISNAEERRISVKARVTDNRYFSYEIENSKVNEIKKSRERILSDKEEKSNHGFGLLNVKEIVEKYSGMIDISYTEKMFRVTILIHNV